MLSNVIALQRDAVELRAVLGQKSSLPMPPRASGSSVSCIRMLSNVIASQRDAVELRAVSDNAAQRARCVGGRGSGQAEAQSCGKGRDRQGTFNHGISLLQWPTTVIGLSRSYAGDAYRGGKHCRRLCELFTLRRGRPRKQRALQNRMAPEYQVERHDRSVSIAPSKDRFRRQGRSAALAVQRSSRRSASPSATGSNGSIAPSTGRYQRLGSTAACGRLREFAT